MRMRMLFYSTYQLTTVPINEYQDGSFPFYLKEEIQ